MQSSILILMLALGLPGANSCNAQQQGLPRVGQAPPAPAAEPQKPAIVDTAEAEDSAADDADDSDEAEMFEIDPGEIAIELPDMDEFGADFTEPPSEDPCTTPCPAQSTPQCQGSGSCQSHSDSMLGSANGQTLHLKKSGKVQSLTIQPGSTVIVETQDGRVQLHTLAGNELPTTQPRIASLPTLDGMFVAQPQGQNNQDDRVRELEQRVKELEAQLRARDNNAPRAYARSFDAFGGRGEGQRARAQAEVERALTRDMQAQAHVQARQYAEQARKQAAEIRAQSDELRKRVQEQVGQWRVRSGDLATWHEAHGGMGGAIAVPVPADPNQACAPEAPAAPGAAAAPVPPAGGGWAGAQSAPAPMARMNPSNGLAAGAMPRMDDMRAMMEQMRAQMEEMRDQMQALRQELQSAPRRELR